MRTVIYHANCYDGVTAAWVCYRYFGKEGVEYIPLNYSDPPPNVKDKDVIIVDFSFKRDIMKKLAMESLTLTCLDHHKTAQEALEDLEEELKNPLVKIAFDMNRSGAGLAWDYFYGKDSRPDLINYVEDRDLWRFLHANSRQINAFIQSFDINLDTWINEVGPIFYNKDLEEIKIAGFSLLRMEEKYVKQICYNAKLKKIDKYIAPYVQTSVLVSEVCDFLIKNYPGNYPFAFYSFERRDGKFQYGLRSRSDFDVSIIAKQFGGGGHKQAAGFELDHPLE